MNAHSANFRILSLIILLAMVLSLIALPNRSVHALAAGISDYYIPTTSGQIIAIFADNDNDTDSAPDLINEADGMHYVIGMTTYVDDTVVYYDHWENGYGFDPVNFTGADEVYYGDQGTVMSFVSTNVPVTRLAAPNEPIAACGANSSNPNGATSNCYDGGDHVYVTGGVAATLTVWPETVGTAYALSWGLYPTKPYQSTYTIPVGENLTSYLDFSNTYVIVQSTRDDNLVTINDPQFTGVEVSVTLDAGESTQLYHIYSGTVVTATYPVQTLYIAGRYHGAGDYALELRGYTGIPTSMWNNEYFNPVSGRTGGNGTDLYIYNPGSAQTVTWQDLSGSGSFSIGAGSTMAYSDGSATNHKVPADSGVRLTATSDFNVIGAADTEAGSYEWGFNLIPSDLLASEYFLGWAPGTRDDQGVPSNNCSPVWVTATQNNTSVSIDYSPADGIYDQTLILDQLESIRIYDPEFNNTGMNLVGNGPFAAAWGEAGLDQSGASCGGSSPNMDLGYTVVPYLDDYVDIVLDLDKTADPTLILNQAGQVVEFTLLASTDAHNVTYMDVIDTLPNNWQYVDDSTTITFPDDSTLTGNAADPSSIIGQVLTWDLSDNLPAGETLSIVFKAITTAAPGGISINTASASGELGTKLFTAMDTATVNISDIQVSKDSNVTGLLKAGDLIDYTLTLANTSLLPHNQIVVRDPLPAGTSYVANSTVVSGKVLGTYLDQFGTAAYNNSNGTFAWSSSWSEGGAESGNNASTGLIIITGGRLQFRDTGTPPRDYYLTRTADLTGASRATLSFTYSEAGNLETEDGFHVDVYDGSDWHTVLTVNNDFTGPLTASYNITNWVNANTQVRVVANGYAGTGEYLYLDNVSIQFDKTMTKDNIAGGSYSDLLNGIPENLVVSGDAFTLPGGAAMTVSYRVQVNNPLDLGLMNIENEVYTSNADDPRESKGSVADALEVIDVSLEGALSDVTPEIGSTVTFTLTVANPTGFQAANNLTVTDIVPTGFAYLPGTITGGTSHDDSNPSGTGLTWTLASLAADSSVVLTYQATTLGTGIYDNYVEITSYSQYDFDSRPGNGQQSPDEDDDVTILIELIAAPALLVHTNTDLTEVDNAGDVIEYTVAVENIGNISLTTISVDDPDVILAYQSGDSNTDGILDVTETWVYSGSYVVTQVEMDAGGTIQSVVTADSAESPADTYTADTPIVQNPALNVSTATNLSEVDSAGDLITYTVEVENTGNISLTGILVSDPAIGFIYGSGDTDLDGELDVTEIWVYTGSHLVTQAEMDAGGIIHTVVTADSIEGELDSFVTDIPIIQAPALDVTTSTDLTEVDNAGDVIHYTVSVENTGNISLTGIAVNDPEVTFIYQSGDTNSNGILDVTETWVYTGSYLVTQAEMDAGGTIETTVTADASESDPDLATTSLPIIQNPIVDITAITDLSSVDEAGDVINYTVSVENTGNVSLSNIDMLGSEVPLTYVSGDTDADGELDVDETWVFTGSYLVTQEDMDAGGVVSTDLIVDTAETAPDTFTSDVTITQNPGSMVSMTSDPTTVDSADDEITYTITVENTGNVTLTGITVTDTPDLVWMLTGDTNSDGELDVDETWVYTGTYTVTQEDIDTGGPIHAEVSVDSNQGEPEIGEVDVTVTQTPGMLVTLSADPTSVDEAGDVIDYTLTVENTGNLTLTGITLVDTPDITWVLTGDADLDGNLDVDEIWTYSASHTLTQAEINIGDPIHLQTDVDSDQTSLETDEVDVLIVNAIPVAVGDSYDMHWSDAGLSITADAGVLDNDNDVNLNPLTAELVTDGINGSVDLAADGSFNYTPTLGYYGPADSFTYRVFDGLDYSEPATVTINFTNTLPAGLADEYSATVNLALSVNATNGLLHNDGDGDGDPITAELVTGPAPAEGSLLLNADGSFTFTPADGFTGDVTFTYRLYDGLEYSDPITVTIHVGGIRIYLPIIRRPAIYKVYLPINVR